MQKRRVYLILGHVGIVLAVVLVAVFSREREPEYGGRRLSEWVEDYESETSQRTANMVVVHFSENQEAAAAVCQIGTNAIPYLLKWIRYETPTWKAILSGILDKISGGRDSVWERDGTRARTRAEHAAKALTGLGPRGEPEIDGLKKLLLDPKQNDNAARRAAFVLSKFGQVGMQAVVEVITNHPPPRSLPYLHVAFSWWGAEAQPAIPALE